MTTRVVGIDLSMTSTGLAACLIDADGAVRERTVGRLETTGRAEATLRQRRERLHDVVRDVAAFAFASPVDLVVIEGPSLGQQRQRGTHDRSGLWWLVVERLLGNLARVAEVSPSARMRYATGRGAAPKDAVLAAAIRRYPEWEITGNDIADAVLLAAMGARHLSRPIETSMPATHLSGLDKVQWPAPTTLDEPGA